MLNWNDIQMLASRPRRRENSVLTLYLDTDQSRQANLNRGFETQLKEMASGIKTAIQNPIELNSFEQSYSRLEDFVRRKDINTRGLVAGYDLYDGFFWAEALNVPLSNRLHWSTETLIEPLVAAAVQNERVGVVLMDRAHLRFFIAFLGEIQEYLTEEFDHRTVRHTKTVGMNNLGAASHAQQRADEHVRLNLQQMIRQIDSLVKQQEIHRLVLAGSTDIVAKLKNSLPKRLVSLVIGAVDIATSASIGEVAAATAPLTQEVLREKAKTTVNDLITLAAKRAPVVMGFAHTLDAANQGRIWKLICADGAQIPGYECGECPAMFAANLGACSFCGSPLRPIEDLVDRVISRLSRKGAKVDIVHGEAAALLRKAGGIGALLRTRTGNHGGLYESESSSNLAETSAGYAETAHNTGNS
jgi:peptide chain release factor subunit 1